jgi:hypothetical protein
MATWRATVAICLLATVLATACTDGPSGVAVSTTSDGGGTFDGGTFDTGPAQDPGPAPVWDRIAAPAKCQCADGSGFHFFIHRNDPTKVLFFLEGGGVCFSAATCGPSSTTYRRSIAHPDHLSDVTTGIFDFGDPRNPFHDWSVVFVPYCTGDAHLGDETHDYGGGVVVHHDGSVNAGTALAALAEFFPKATQVVVAGESAGGIAAPLYAGLAKDALPDARIAVLADGSGAFPADPTADAMLDAAWGVRAALPDWPENRGPAAESWSVPSLFVQTHRHAPDVVLARHDFAFDATQADFLRLAGVSATDVRQLIDTNEQQIESTGANLLSYISPGTSHTVLSSPDFYSETQRGTSLLQWVTDLVAGRPATDVHCTACT